MKMDKSLALLIGLIYSDYVNILQLWFYNGPSVLTLLSSKIIYYDFLHILRLKNYLRLLHSMVFKVMLILSMTDKYSIEMM